VTTIAPKHKVRRITTYRFLMTFILGFMAALVFAGVVLAIEDPGLITGSSAFGPGGYLREFSALGYYRFVIVLLAISSITFVAGASIAAFTTTVRTSWRRKAGVQITNSLHSVLDWLAAFVFLAFMASLFLLILPIGEIGAYLLLGSLSAVFGVVVYFALWARRVPRGLISAMDMEALFQDLKTIDLDTSVLEPMVESVAVVVPSTSPVDSSSEAASQLDSRLRASTRVVEPTSPSSDSTSTFFSRSLLGDLALASVPGFLGLMGLAQLKEGRRTRGLVFLGLGLVLGGLSSWYIILSARIGELLSGQPMPAVSSLSWLASAAGAGSAGVAAVLVLLLAFLALWAYQLYDGISYSTRLPST
jgi:hypothetical protein